jgi:dipeptidase E
MNLLRRVVVLLVVSWCSVAALRAAAPSVMVSGGSMMKGDHFADSNVPPLREHFAGVKRVALVLHATHPEDYDRMEARLQKAFAHLNGASAESLHRRDLAGQRALLERADGIFVGGGETFVLLAELHRTGQLDVIRQRVAAGVPYLGSSAGSNVAGRLIGTTNDFPVAEIPTRAALGIFPAVINPHHPEANEAEFKGRAGKIAIYLRFNRTDTVVALGNASLVRLQGGEAKVVAGSAWVYQLGKSRALAVGDRLQEIEPKR